MFGGSPSYSASRSSASGQMKARNQRVLLSGSPYHCAAASRIAAKQQGRQRPSHSSSTTPSPSGKFWNQISFWNQVHSAIFHIASWPPLQTVIKTT